METMEHRTFDTAVRMWNYWQKIKKKSDELCFFQLIRTSVIPKMDRLGHFPLFHVFGLRIPAKAEIHSANVFKLKYISQSDICARKQDPFFPSAGQWAEGQSRSAANPAFTHHVHWAPTAAETKPTASHWTKDSQQCAGSGCQGAAFLTHLPRCQTWIAWCIAVSLD